MDPQPIGDYSIPELSNVGTTEVELVEARHGGVVKPIGLDQARQFDAEVQASTAAVDRDHWFSRRR
jgi:hypothetical protein